MPAATFWVVSRLLAQTWVPFAAAAWSGVPAGLQNLNPIWVLLLAFALLSVLSSIMHKGATATTRFSITPVGRTRSSMVVGLIAPVVYVRPLFSERRD